MLVAVHRSGDILRLTISRPDKRNALSRAVGAELAQALETHREDAALKLLVLTGQGERAFSSGGDLAELNAVRTAAAAVEMSESFGAVLDALRAFPLPTVAALNGDALGGGAELAMACDLRVAARHARIGFLQGKLNISTAWGGGVDLLRAVGCAKGLRLLGLAEALTATQAFEAGLLDAIAPENRPFDAFVEDFCTGYIARTAQVLRSFKTLLCAYRRGASHEELRLIETRHFARNWVHEDHWAALEASRRRVARA